MTTPGRANRGSPGTTTRARDAAGRRAGRRRAPAAGASARAGTRREGGRGGGVAGAGRRAGRRTGRGLRRHRRAVADRAAGRAGPGDLHRRSRGPARAQDPLPTPGRLQGPRRGRAGHRDHHRHRPDPGRRAATTPTPPSGSHCCSADTEPRAGVGWRCWPTPPTAPARRWPRCRGRAHPDHQALAAAPGRGGRVHPRRLHRHRTHRRPAGIGDLPERDHPPDHPDPQRDLRRGLSRLPAARPLHHLKPRRTNCTLHPHDALTARTGPAPRTPDSRPSTASTGPWSNARSPGWSPAATAGCGSAGHSSTTVAAPPRRRDSTCADCSTSASPAPRAHG